MKKFTFTLFTLFSAVLINAQIALTYKTHGLMVGDAHNFILAKPVVEGPAGADQLWDFSNLEANGKLLTSYMLDPKTTDNGNQIDDDANTVIEESGTQFFFDVNKHTIKQYGTVTTCGSVLTYDKPFVKMEYPFTFGNSFTGSFSGKQTSTNGASSEINGIYDVKADGYGTLLLPDGAQIDNVLRIKTVRTRIAENYEYTIITYRWYCESVRYPILVIIQHETPSNSYTSTVAYYKDANKLKSSPLSVIDNTTQVGLNAYPNPFNDIINFDYNISQASNISIELYDATGRKIKTLLKSENQQEGNHAFSLSATQNGFSAGIYYVKINVENNKSLIKKIVRFD